MKRNTLTGLSIFLCIIGGVTASTVYAEDSEKQLLDKAYGMMDSIYKTGDFAGEARSFRGTWLADSSGYSVREWDSTADKRVRVRYDVVTGERTLLNERQQEQAGRNRGSLNSDWRRGSGRGGTSPDGRLVLSFKEGQLQLRTLDSDKTISLTQNADGDAIYNSNAVWSPDSKWIAFMENDRSAIPFRATLEPSDPTYPEVKQVRYSRVGEPINKTRVGIVDPKGKAIRWLSIAQPAEGCYLGGLSWAGNSYEVFIEKLSRGRDKREFLIADIHTGAIRSLFEESDEAWVAGAYETDAGPVWIRKHRAFIVMSDRDGWRRSYLYTRDGKEEGVLTPENVDVMEFAAVDEARAWYYYYASPENATQLYLYRSQLDGSGKTERVTPADQPGTHRYTISPDHKWALHSYSTFDTPPVTELVRLSDHNVMRQHQDNKALRDEIESWMPQPTEFFQVDIGDDVVMDGYMIKPRDFDPSKKYPMFIYTYSEPYAQEVLDKWRGQRDYFHRAVAEMGYLVVCMDSRGTPAPKGTSWRKAEFPTLGILSTDDQAAAVKELGDTRPYVDPSRVGIWGWSGGGSNTLNALFRKPDVYSLGIAVVPKPQPHLYNSWFQEIFMRTLKENEEGYRKSAPINFAEGLEGDLLIITGTGETNTHVQIVEGLVDRLIELDKKFDYFPYPNRDHGLREGKGTTLHLRKHMMRYLITHMPPGPQ
jgi:dipeptidyl-peptidase-4